MKYKDFIWNIKRLHKQKKAENDEVNSNTTVPKTTTAYSDRRKYLG